MSDPDRIVHLLLLGRSVDAERIARDLLRSTPGDTRLRRLLAWALLHQGRRDEAEDEVASVITDAPFDAEAHRLLGHLSCDRRRYDDADRSFTEAIRLDPLDHLARVDRAQMLLNCLDDTNIMSRRRALRTLERGADRVLVRAEADLDEALRLEPNDARAMRVRARLAIARDHPVEARDWFTRALEIDPQDAEAHLQLGVLAEERGDVRSASEHFLSAGRADPSDGSALERLRQLGTPTLAIPGIVLFLIARTLLTIASTGTAAAILIGSMSAICVAGWYHHRHSVRAEQRARFVDDARRVVERDLRRGSPEN